MAIIEFKEIIAATTDAKVAGVTFNVHVDRPRSVFVDGLAGVETASLYYTLDKGVTFILASDDNGPILLTASKNSILVEGPGIYSIAKDATVGAVEVVVAG